ncbi:MULTISPECIES: S-layer homology domain-containing protein [unclassified Paenibacillus]|uniref:S-layer homology domain-containing protein n=1 Tax=unclassified Paenibacillus TaxID=185978 RepID=UPI001AE73E28|nr:MULTISPECIES: S-layer homology domain-containing protein [unclassified Paenibacillus]MBP1154186.1 hypothetical protein [Paenibacillus sp. PvP091]MBP1170429.1 hypothetical protein [Paenibacillus sp. PvR098]MBP2441457.1 hypothetical protein [Paenibacillus sp. PvP052]
MFESTSLAIHRLPLPSGSFRGNNEITREEAAVLLGRTWAYIQSRTGAAPGNTGTTRSGSFTDQEGISGYALEAVEYARFIGLINGYEDGSFRPQGYANRAETVSMILNLLQKAMFINP